MKITSIDQFQKHHIYYKAYSLGTNSFVWPFVYYGSEPSKIIPGFTRCICRSIGFSGKWMDDDFYPGDANIGAHHNEHYIFTSREEAEDYLTSATTNG